MKFVELTGVDLAVERRMLHPETADFSENVPVDDLEQPLLGVAAEEKPLHYPVQINVDNVRSFYARRHGLPEGTRIVYMTGAAQIVKETYDQVKSTFLSLNN